MGDYVLTIELDKDVVAKQSKDNLCIAKKVAGEFTTVFQDASIKPARVGQKPLYRTNEFAWKDQYRVFAAVEYRVGLLVKSATDAVDMRFGQSTQFQNSEFQSPKAAPTTAFPGGDSTSKNSFIAKSVPDSLQTAVQCFAGGAWVSIYVDPEKHNGDMDKILTPLNEYMLFWSSNTRTESMIDNSRSSDAFTFSFPPGKTSKKVRFGYATANNPEAMEGFKFYNAD